MFSQKIFRIFCAICKVSETTESLRYFFKPFSKNRSIWQSRNQWGNRMQESARQSTGPSLQCWQRIILLFAQWTIFNEKVKVKSPASTSWDWLSCVKRYFLIYLEHGGITFTFPLLKKINNHIFVDLFPN